MPPEARRTRRPRRWIGTAANGYSAAAIRLSSQSRYTIEATSPITVTSVGDAIHRTGQRLANHRGVGGETRGELRRGLALHPRQVGMREMGEHPGLQRADHQQNNLLDLHVLEVLRQRLDRGHRDDQRGKLVENPPVAGGKHLEGVVDHHRIKRRGAGHQQSEHQDQQQTRLVVADMLAPQPAKQRSRRGTPRQHHRLSRNAARLDHIHSRDVSAGPPARQSPKRGRPGALLLDPTKGSGPWNPFPHHD